MAEKVKKDQEPWSPRIESDPLFINSADFERGLGEASKSPDIEDEGADEDDELEDPATPNPFIKPAG